MRPAKEPSEGETTALTPAGAAQGRFGVPPPPTALWQVLSPHHAWLHPDFSLDKHNLKFMVTKMTTAQIKEQVIWLQRGYGEEGSGGWMMSMI